MKRYAKNIALVLFKYFPYGGLQRDFFSIAKELKERGHSIKVFTRTWDGAIPSWLDVIEVGEKGITNASKNRKFVENVIFEIKKDCPDIVFGFNKMPGLDLYFAADTCFAKYSLEKHFLQKFTNRSKQAIQYEKDVFSKKSKTKILLLNSIQKTDFTDVYETPEDRIQIIPPGLDRNWLNVESFNIRDELKISDKDKIMLFVGSDFSRKGLDRAVLGLEYLMDKHIPSSLIVIGDDKDSDFLELITKKNLVSRIKFMGPRNDVASFMKSSDILVHPAREEAAGNVVIEAIIAGLPSIVSSEVGFSEEILKFNSGNVLNGAFSQKAFNSLLAEAISDENLEKIRLSIRNIRNRDYFFSRFKFVADYIENNFL